MITYGIINDTYSSLSISLLDLRGTKSTKLPVKNYVTSVLKVDCEQSLFFFRVHARASVKRRSRETRETRVAAREEKGESLFCRASPVSRLHSRGWSFACLGRFARRTKTKERLLVVCTKNSWADARFYRSLPLMKTIPSRKSQNQKNGF